MNTTLDESLIARWLDEEALSSEEQSALTAILAAKPELHELHRDTQAWRAEISQLPAAQTPPYPDFFNSRILRRIQLPMAVPPAATSSPRWSLKHWLMPLSACAGMVVAFWAGTHRPTHSSGFGTSPQAAEVHSAPVFYTPEHGVNAEWYDSDAANATVIVLQGVHAIPDTTDFSTHFPLGREVDRTAIRDNPSRDTRTQ